MTGPIAQILPPWIVEQVGLVYLTGVLEGTRAAGFLLNETRKLTGWVALLVPVSFFPVNVNAAADHIPVGGHATNFPMGLHRHGPAIHDLT